MSKFKVLLVPGSVGDGLDLYGEMLRLSNIGSNSDNIAFEVVQPNRSTEIDLVQLTRGDGKRFDCLHFLGHSDGQSFTLASGDVLTEDKILALCRDAGAKVLFMNACSSAALCQYAANTTVAVALAWAKEVVDSDAIVAAMRFYGALADYGDPWGSGLRRAYEAVGEKRSFLWFTDGEYVSQMIAPIIARLDRFDAERKEAFNLFSGRLDSIVQSLSDMGTQVMGSLSKVTQSYSKIRALLYAIAVLVVVTILFLAYSFATSAQTIPPNPTSLPGCDQSGGQPKKCQTPTVDIKTGTATEPTKPVETPTFVSTAIETQTPTETTIAPPGPTETATEAITDTPTPKPTLTKERSTNTPTSTYTPLPTVELPTVTPTPTETLDPCK